MRLSLLCRAALFACLGHGRQHEEARKIVVETQKRVSLQSAASGPMRCITRSARYLFCCGTIFLAAVASLSPLLHAQTPSQGGGVAAVGAPTFQVLRSLAGTSGTESNGRFVMDDPRTTFHLGQDKKVIVYFEWSGPIGPHKF